jgi:hypothetical protein
VRTAPAALPEIILREQLGAPHGLVQVLLDGAFLATRIPVPRKQALWSSGNKKPTSKKASNDDLSFRRSMPAMLAGSINTTRCTTGHPGRVKWT